MSENEIHVEDIGTVFEVEVKDGDAVVDISSATTKELVFSKPDGSVLTKPAVFVTDGTDGKLKYTTIADDLSDPGNWKLQVYIVMSGGAWRTDIGDFIVFDNI